MDYEYEFSRLFDTVDQYVKANGTSKAAKRALLNAHQFYATNLKSSNNKYMATQATPKSCSGCKHSMYCANCGARA